MPPRLLHARPVPKLLSLVIPLYNEEASVSNLETQLSAWRQRVACATEIVFVNDGSTDGTAVRLNQWAAADSSVKVLHFSANFGHQAAVTAGLKVAAGEAIAILDADLQDPLDVISEMLVRYCEGYDVIYGQRISRRGETLFKRLTAWLFYRFMRTFLHRRLPVDTGDFRLVSRRCLDAVLSLNETHRFLRGLFAWVGFEQIGVPYHRQPRQYGSTKYPASKMLRLAWHAALSFSVVPIKLITATGFGVALFGVTYGAYSILRHFVWQDTVPGWTTLVVLLSIIGGALLVAIGIIGEYVGRIYEEVKRRPLFIVQEKINLD
jgi:dolichol-phosphate mannosyltransferase